MSVQDTPSYKVYANDHLVLGVSPFHIPFQPNKSENKNQIISFRNDLREYIKKLVVPDGKVFFATYWESDKYRFYDVENLLFYNIGISTFSKCCENQLAFVGDTEKIIAKKYSNKYKNKPNHVYRYEFVAPDLFNSMLSRKRMIVSWENIPININIPHSPLRYYDAIRKNISGINIYTNDEYNDVFFGIKINITLTQKTFPASVMKALLDGVICAFHGEKTNSTIEVLKELLKTDNINPINVLGKREYIVKFNSGNFYKWNPEDERLIFAWIIVNSGEKAEMSGEIYNWEWIE